MKPSAYPEAAFLSEVTASATHEIRNVLAIIKESNGLMGDMVQICARGEPLDAGRMVRALDRVDMQVRRGADILTGLNRLSHSLDAERAALNLHEEVALAVFMSGRKARNRRQTLKVLDPSAELQVSASPIHLQMALYGALKVCIEELPEGSSISVGVERAAGGPTVVFLGEMPSENGGPELDGGDPWREAEDLVSNLGARMETIAGGSGIKVSFGPA